MVEPGAGADRAPREELAQQDRGDAIVGSMVAGGIDCVFFTSGTEIGFYQEAIARRHAAGEPAPRLVGMTHEHVALNAALGYSAVSGKPSATAAHVDVGTQHHGCAIHTAWHSGLPIVMTAGAAPAAGVGTMRGARDGTHLWVQQGFDQHSIVRPYVKWDHRLDWQDDAGLVVSRALQVACTEPQGPVYLSLPRELVLLPQQGESPSAAKLGIPRPAAPDAEGIQEIAERLLRAKNPFVVAGSGRDPRCVTALVQLAELLALPVVELPTRAYQCFPMDHPLYLGAASLREADFVLLLEAVVPWLPGPSAPAAEAFVASIDVDPVKTRIPTYEFTADLRLTADSLAAIQALTGAVKRLIDAEASKRIAERSARWAQFSESQRNRADDEARQQSRAVPIDPRWLAHCIARHLDDDSLLMDDTTHNRLTPYLRMRRAGAYFHNPGSGGGWAMGAAFGAKLAAPDRDVVAVTGDGFYMFGVPSAALWAAAKHKAPFMTVVFQNRSYATGTTGVAAAYPGGYAARGGFEGGYLEPAIDFAREAEAAGAHGENVRDPGDIPGALDRGRAATREGRCAVLAVWLPRLLQRD